MQVTGWTYWGNDHYKDLGDMTSVEFEAAEIAVKNELKEKGYKFTGSTHQYSDGCCPIIDNKYTYSVSMRTWGRIIAEAYDLPNEDGFGYVKWAWSPPEGEKEILPVKEVL